MAGKREEGDLISLEEGDLEIVLMTWGGPLFLALTLGREKRKARGQTGARSTGN